MIDQEDPVNAERLGQDLTQLTTSFTQLVEEMSGAVLGQGEVLVEAMIALIAEGHLLLEGPPGVGKTLSLKALSQVSGLSMKRVQCTPEVMPSDLLGGPQLTQGPSGPELTHRFGPIFTQIFFADEINRATPRTQAALLEAMGERQISVDGVLHPLPRPFLLVATQNPLDHEGTYPLPEAQLDRFFFKSMTPHPSPDIIDQLLGFNADQALANLKPMVGAEELLHWSSLTQKLSLTREARSHIVQLIVNSRPQEAADELRPLISDGLSPRAGRDLFRAAQIHAALNGKLIATEDDVRRCLLPCLRHRLRLSWEARSQRVRPEEIIQSLARQQGLLG